MTASAAPAVPATSFFRRTCSRASVARTLASTAVLSAAIACADRGAGAPAAEFIVAAGDSTYWVRSGHSGAEMRGSPLVLARLGGRFLELYVVDDDRSYEDAMFIGQRLYQRDIVSGDSAEIFNDTLVAALADRYEMSHPDSRRLGPDEDSAEEPSTTATAEVSVLGVHGPFLSIEYHVDTSGATNDTWHMTRHGVIDLRIGKQVALADVLGATEARAVVARGRALYAETVDSVRRDRRPSARRAARSITHFHFDPASFSLTAPNGALMIAFSGPGQGLGGEGFVLPIRPIAVAQPSWWSEARASLPTSTREREDRWTRPGYAVTAVYDSAEGPVNISILDSAGAETRVGAVSWPVHRIYWLDQPALAGAERQALAHAFDEAAAYDADTRSAFAGEPSHVRLAARE